MTTQQEAMGLLSEIADRAEMGVWTKDLAHPILQGRDPSAVAYTGTLGDWTVLVVTFAAAKDRGYAGAGAKGGMVVKLTPGIAERIYKIAQAHVDGQNAQPAVGVAPQKK